LLTSAAVSVTIVYLLHVASNHPSAKPGPSKGELLKTVIRNR
jgi:hypothetical protein